MSLGWVRAGAGGSLGWEEREAGLGWELVWWGGSADAFGEPGVAGGGVGRHGQS